MTYLELVNAVLRKLREDEVTTVAESPYSTMIGDIVNDAKQLVEDSWDWTSLRDSHTITTVSGTFVYSLTDFTPRSKVLYANNETENMSVRQQSLQKLRDMRLGAEDQRGNVQFFSVSGTDSNGDLQVLVWPTPDSTETLTVYGVKRPPALVADADTLSVPSQPVIQWAYSYALRERGETGGDSGAEQAIFAKNDLSTAIALDANHHPEELIWTTV